MHHDEAVCGWLRPHVRPRVVTPQQVADEACLQGDQQQAGRVISGRQAVRGLCGLRSHHALVQTAGLQERVACG